MQTISDTDGRTGAGEDMAEDMAVVGEAGEDMAAGEEDIGAAEGMAGVDEDMVVVGVAGVVDTGVELRTPYSIRVILYRYQRSLWPIV